MKNVNGKTYEEMYLDYFNNFLGVDSFAEYYGVTESQANTIINIGRMQNHKEVTVDGFVCNNS